MTRITFLGDVFLPRPYRVGVDLGERFVFNLEHPITPSAAGWPGKINLKAEENHIAATFGRAPAAVGLANNHIMDYGPRGLDDTLRELRALGVAAFGAGSLQDNMRNPLVLPGTGAALLGYACPTTAAVFATPERPGAAPLELARVRRDIEAARHAGARRVIAVLHWGEEHVFLPKPGDVSLGRRIVDAGADLVIGHHAHCIQPFERYRGRFIFYGLGNCITPDVDQPSYFDASGRPTRRATRKQQWWNKRSLAVDYDTETGAVTVRELRFDGAALREAAAGADRYQLALGGGEAYEARYRRAFALGKLRNKAMILLTSPRRPRARHLKSLVAIAREVRHPQW